MNLPKKVLGREKAPSSPLENKHTAKVPMDLHRRGWTVRAGIRHSNPLMEALLKAYEAKNLAQVKVLLSSGLPVNYKDPTRSNKTPLVMAAKFNFVEAVVELIESGADPRLSDDAGITPLHSAASNGSLEPLKRLLGEQEVDPNVRDMHGRTPLYCATQTLSEDEEDNALNIVQALLKAGASVAIKDIEDRTPIHAAAWAGNAEVLTFLLSAQGASFVSVKDKYGRTPLHQAALGARSLLVVKILLHYTAPIDATDTQGRTALHYIAERSQNYVDKEFDRECLELLLSCGASVRMQDNDGYNALSLSLQRTMWWSKSPRDAVLHCVQLLVAKGSSIIDAFDMWRIIETFPSLAMVALNQSIRSNTSAKDSPHMRLTFQFDPLVQNTRLLSKKTKNVGTPVIPSDEMPIPTPLLCDSEIAMLHYIFWAGNKSILRHPLCSAFLHLKWLKVRKFFIIHVICYLLFVIAFTLFILSCFWKHSVETRNDISGSNTTTDRIPLHSVLGGEMKLFMWWFILISLIIFATKEVLQIGHSPSIYFRHYENYMDVFILISVVLLLPEKSKVHLEWGKQISIAAVIVSWARIMLFLGQFPSCGVYVVMFSKVCKTVLRFLLLYLPLLIAFSFGFLILFHEMDSPTTIVSTFVSTMIMMTGEIDVQDKIMADQNPSSKLFSSLILIVFLLLMYIILSNLLVALAVNDLNSIQQRSELLRLTRQVELMVTVNTFLKSPCIPRIVKDFLIKELSITEGHSESQIAIFPNKKLGFTENLYLKILFIFRCRKLLTKIFEQFVVNFIPPESEPSLPITLVREATQLALTEREIEKRDRLLFSKSHQIGSLRHRGLQRKDKHANPTDSTSPFWSAKDTSQEWQKTLLATEENKFDLTMEFARQQIGPMQQTPSLKAALWRATVRKEACRHPYSPVLNNERLVFKREIEDLRQQISSLKGCIETLIMKLPSRKFEEGFKRTSLPTLKPKYITSPLVRSPPQPDNEYSSTNKDYEVNVATPIIVTQHTQKCSSDDENTTTTV